MGARTRRRGPAPPPDPGAPRPRHPRATSRARRDIGAGQRPVRGADVGGARRTTQIYEGTNQVQRIVMARQLLAGVQSQV
ncbi:hypothetical protein E8D34_06175 [Nocardioides sp. GY 10113]|nr:hypothetical protein E8D34_06175 [Nocardioides sp. GY 10113]